MPPHTKPAPKQLLLALLVVGASGGIGTLLRDLALRIGSTSLYKNLVGATSHATVLSWSTQIPWILMILNIVGVYLATSLLFGRLRAHDPNNLLRLTLITGFFGGLTSYSSLFVSLSIIWHDSKPAAFLVGMLALLSGIGAGWLGSRRHSR